MGQRYDFDRHVGGQKMAEGVAVHAESKDAAWSKAQQLAGDDTDELRFAGIGLCSKMARCKICERMQLAQRTNATPVQVAGSLAAVDEYDAAKRGE